MLFLLATVVVGEMFERDTLKSWDGTPLRLKINDPPEASTTVVILPNSWGNPSMEYHFPMENFLGRSVEYETRGFFGSGGVIGLAGPDDVKDVSAVIDWALQRWPEVENVALCGVSYGGGLSLLGAAHDERVTKVVAYSAWPSLYENLNPNASPNRIWANLLLILGAVTGRETREVFEIWNDVRTHTNLSYVQEWSNLRDPSYVRKNLTKVPILLLSNLDDGLFLSQHTFDFWMRLPGQKAIIFAGGTHAQAEMPGIFDLETNPNGPWHRARDWIHNTTTQSRVTFLDVENQPRGSGGLDFLTWPPPAQVNLTLGLRWGGTNHGLFRSSDFGILEEDESNQRRSSSTKTRTMRFGSSKVSSGHLPVIESFIKAFTSLPMADIGAAAREATSLVFLHDDFRDVILCGVPELRGLNVVPQQRSFQLYAYLYAADTSERDRHLMARFVAAATFTAWDDAIPGRPYAIPTLQFATTAFRMLPGTRLALAFNMKNELFTPATNSNHATLHLLLGPDTSLVVPTIPS